MEREIKRRYGGRQAYVKCCGLTVSKAEINADVFIRGRKQATLSKQTSKALAVKDDGSSIVLVYATDVERDKALASLSKTIESATAKADIVWMPSAMFEND